MCAIIILLTVVYVTIELRIQSPRIHIIKQLLFIWTISITIFNRVFNKYFQMWGLVDILNYRENSMTPLFWWRNVFNPAPPSYTKIFKVILRIMRLSKEYIPNNMTQWRSLSNATKLWPPSHNIALPQMKINKEHQP